MLISLTQGCYETLRKIRETMREQKRMNCQPDKTTFSEVVCTFITYYERNEHGKNDDGRTPLLPSGINKELLRNDINEYKN